MNDYYKINEKIYPMVAIRGIWVIPGMVVHFDVARSISKKALDKALLEDMDIFLLNQKDVLVESPKLDDLYDFGTVAKIKQTFTDQNGNVKVLVEGLKRAKLKSLNTSDGYFSAIVDEYEYIEDKFSSNEHIEALKSLTIKDLLQNAKTNMDEEFPVEFSQALIQLKDPEKFSNTIVSYMTLSPDEYYDILKELDIEERLNKIHKLFKKQIELNKLSRKIDMEVQENLNESQREYFLREKIAVIKKELNEDQEENGIEGYTKKINSLSIDKTSKEVLLKEVKKLENIPSMSPDYGVITTFLDFALKLPWDKKTNDKIDIKKARDELNKNHYGLEEVKQRILEFIAVRKKKDNKSGSIICLVGPPGVGKTSIAKSIANALNRKFISMRLGGVGDESEIRGHRKTYVGAMSGRIISSIDKVGVKNPVFLLDEIDKLGSDFRGDPSSALLEVLDPEQNDEFTDRYLEIPFDLSEVFFITTANDPSSIPQALYDRMEIIEISGYTEEEKFQIAKKYLIKKQREMNGLKANEISITDSVIRKIIKQYTREAGVRELERFIAKICRKSALLSLEEKESGKDGTIKVTLSNCKDFLGKPKFIDSISSKEDKIGIVNGLAWTAVGGTILAIECQVMSGKGNIILTGSLGDVMKESAQAAISYIRANYKSFSLEEDFYQKLDFHIHAPEGAVKKEGPSAGVTMTTALVSALTKRKVKSSVAMTGEISLMGNVLAIGGLKEKALAAYSNGIKTIIIPKENEVDLEEIPDEIRKDIEFVPVDNIKDVLKKALV